MARPASQRWSAPSATDIACSIRRSITTTKTRSARRFASRASRARSCASPRNCRAGVNTTQTRSPAVEESLRRAGLDYFDLYLIHWPNPNQGLYVEAWGALIECRKRGLTRSIGVSNFLPEHLDRLIRETGVTPSVNQIELHPYFPQEEQRRADRERGVLTQAWSPLTRGNALFREEAIVRIAARLGRTVAQVILRWHVQLGVEPLPKAASPERQVENLAVFDFALSAKDMAAIAALARPDGRLRDQDPARYEEF